MRNTKYTYKFKIPNDDELVLFENMNMVELCQSLKDSFKKYYDIDEITISRNVIHNLTRKVPIGHNKLLKAKATITKQN